MDPIPERPLLIPSLGKKTILWSSGVLKMVGNYLEVQVGPDKAIRIWRTLVGKICDHFDGSETSFLLVFDNLFATTMKLP